MSVSSYPLLIVAIRLHSLNRIQLYHLTLNLFLEHARLLGFLLLCLKLKKQLVFGRLHLVVYLVEQKA